jgi:hypothetical protein
MLRVVGIGTGQACSLLRLYAPQIEIRKFAQQIIIQSLMQYQSLYPEFCVFHYLCVPLGD